MGANVVKLEEFFVVGETKIMKNRGSVTCGEPKDAGKDFYWNSRYDRRLGVVEIFE